MKNRIKINSPVIEKNRISCTYALEGEWSEVFYQDINNFFTEYSIDISNVPESIAVIPFLANILPMAWVFDAEIYLPSIDRDFYESIPEFKKGYQDMYPMVDFGGSIIADKVVSNTIEGQKGSAAFFSGGVDAFSTLTCHIDEKPTLITVWGADVKLDDVSGWNKVESHISETSKEFEIDYVTVKSSFREYFDEWKMSQKVEQSGDGWWHGFQHGVGIISHAAPVMYVLRKKNVYFASSFTIADKGKVTCASDPTIDNYIHFCGSNVIHDGYEFTRQDKVHNITQFAEKSEKKIALRVCWESTGGSNCCDCEKCWRTILAVYAEGFNPKDFGFNYADFGELLRKIHRNHESLKWHRESRYAPIQKKLRENYTVDKVEKELVWFYKTDIDQLGEISIPHKIVRKINRIFK